jgi:hypothetical protein
MTAVNLMPHRLTISPLFRVNVHEKCLREQDHDSQIRSLFLEATASNSIEAWRCLGEFLDNYPTFSAHDSDRILLNCFAALSPGDTLQNRLILQIAFYVCRSPETVQSLFTSPSFPSIVHAFLTRSSDPGILATLLNIIQECCDCFSRRPLFWAFAIQADVLALVQSESWHGLRCLLCCVARKLFPFCDLADDQSDLLYDTFVPGIRKLGALPLIDWLHATSLLFRRFPALYDRLRSDPLSLELASLLTSNLPKIVKYAATIITPIGHDLLPNLVEMDIPTVFVRQHDEMHVSFVALLGLMRDLTEASVEVCRQCIDAQFFAFANLYRCGFRVGLMALRVLANLAARDAVPADEPSKHAIAGAVESFLEADDEDAVILLLRLVADLTRLGYEFDVRERIHELAGMAEMPAVAELAAALAEMWW